MNNNNIEVRRALGLLRNDRTATVTNYDSAISTERTPVPGSLLSLFLSVTSSNVSIVETSGAVSVLDLSSYGVEAGTGVLFKWLTAKCSTQTNLKLAAGPAGGRHTTYMRPDELEKRMGIITEHAGGNTSIVDYANDNAYVCEDIANILIGDDVITGPAMVTFN